MSDTTSRQGGIFIPGEYLDVCEGDATAALFLAQLAYWSRRSGGEWVVKTYTDWSTELRMTREKVDRVCRFLKAKGFLRTEVHRWRGGTPKTHYRLDLAAVASAVAGALMAGFTPADSSETHNSSSVKPTNQTADTAIGCVGNTHADMCETHIGTCVKPTNESCVKPTNESCVKPTNESCVKPTNDMDKTTNKTTNKTTEEITLAAQAPREGKPLLAVPCLPLVSLHTNEQEDLAETIPSDWPSLFAEPIATQPAPAASKGRKKPSASKPAASPVDPRVMPFCQGVDATEKIVPSQWSRAVDAAKVLFVNFPGLRTEDAIGAYRLWVESRTADEKLRFGVRISTFNKGNVGEWVKRFQCGCGPVVTAHSGYRSVEEIQARNERILAQRERRRYQDVADAVSA